MRPSRQYILLPMLLVAAVMAPSVCLANADKVFKENYKAVVTIYTYDKNGSRLGMGSGFLAKSDGTIITNRHVIEGARIVKVKIGKRFFKGRPVYIGKRSDVAIVKVENVAGELPVVQLGDSTKVSIGEKVYVIGNPAGLEKSLSDGIVSGIRRIKNMRQDFIQFTAPISPGSSGGPVFNKDGKVIGIATGSMEEVSLNTTQNLNLATPIDVIKNKIADKGQIKADAKVVMNRLFNHKGMMYFFIGIVMIFFACRIPFLKKWLDFLHTLQHELVHHAVAGCFGGTPESMEVDGQGGAAGTTKDNFIVRISPYVLPFFSLIILGISYLLEVEYRPVAFILAGLFYGNFIRRSFSLLHIQPDIQKSGGRLITYPFIFIANVAVLTAIGHMVRGL
jgi:hypothetical protein